VVPLSLHELPQKMECIGKVRYRIIATRIQSPRFGGDSDAADVLVEAIGMHFSNASTMRMDICSITSRAEC
jgi:hypothetical protein